MRPAVDRFTAAALVLVPVAFGLFALSLGQDSNWDLRNYHWYDPYAFLTGRLARDLGPAHVATFYNPVLDLPLYLVGQHLPAKAVGFGLGLLHGLNYVLLYFIAGTLLAPWVADPAHRRLAAAVIAIVGVTGGGHLALVGTTFNDNVVSLLLFAAMLIVLRREAAIFTGHNAAFGAGAVLMAGAVVGVAVGLKLPTAPFAVGCCVAFLFVPGPPARRFAAAVLFGIGVVGGFALSGGPWMWRLWRDYGNPLFPYFNGFFRSPMGLPDSYRDARFIPDSIGRALAFPLIFTRDPKAVGEIVFRDARILCAYAALIVSAVIAIAGRMRRGPPLALGGAARWLIAAAVVAYVLWMLIFGIYRYIVPLEILAPLITILLLAVWPLPARARLALAAVALVAVTATTRRGDWEHLPWSPGPFVSAQPPAVADPSRTLALMTGLDPTAWLIPFFPPEIPFLRIQGYLNSPDQKPNGLNAKARALIAAHTGAFFLLYPDKQETGAVAALAAYGLAADFASCQPVRSNLGDYARWCRVYPISAPSP